MLSSSHHTHRIYPVHPLARWPYVKRSTLECEFFDPDSTSCGAQHGGFLIWSTIAMRLQDSDNVPADQMVRTESLAQGGTIVGGDKTGARKKGQG